MICHRQGLEDKNTNKNKNTKTNTYNDRYKNNEQTYVVICFWKGDDKMSLIMQNMKNMQNMQNMQKMQNMQNMLSMQNMQNISPLLFLSKDQKSKISESESSINSRTYLGHLVLLYLF